jgi:DNA-binding response OmpR family regulator
MTSRKGGIFIVNRQAKILIVEDNEQASDFLQTLLKRRGYAVSAAATLAGARERLADPPDLITLDNDMPDGKGLDFLRELRKTSQVPVIMATGCSNIELKMAAFEAGCDDFIEKPYAFDTVIAGIERLLSRGSRDAPKPSPD